MSAWVGVTEDASLRGFLRGSSAVRFEYGVSQVFRNAEERRQILLAGSCEMKDQDVGDQGRDKAQGYNQAQGQPDHSLALPCW